MPGLVLYLSYFYPRQLMHWRYISMILPHVAYSILCRISLFFSTASLGGAFSGLLAFGIVHMDGVGNKRGWRWIFILEGLFTICFGIFSFLVLPRSPTHARFLNTEEKTIIATTLERDGSTTSEDDLFSWREVGMAFALPQVWMLAIVALGGGMLIPSPHPDLY